MRRLAPEAIEPQNNEPSLSESTNQLGLINMAKNTRTTTATAPVQNDENAATNDPTTEYLNADRSGRAQMRAAWESAISEAIRAADLDAAQSAMGARDAAVTAAGAGRSSEPVDYNALVAERVAVLLHAAALVRSGETVPVGVDPEQVDLETVESMLSDMAGDEATTNERTHESAHKIASERVARSGKRNNVAEFIQSRLTELGSGDWRVSELRHGQHEAPSSGAVSAALNAVLDGTRTVEGFEAVSATDSTSGALSARLV